MQNGRFPTIFFLITLFLLTTACTPLLSTTQELVPLPTRMPVASVPDVPTWTPRPTVAIPPTHTPAGSPVLDATSASLPTSTPAPSATPDPFAGYTVADLGARTYGDGVLEAAGVIEETNLFTRYLITYPSDGLTIYGFMNVPKNVTGSLPVVLLLHGYVNPAEYNTLTYTTSHADFLAENGFLVLHPNFRNYPPSSTGPNDLRAGFALDVLNLIALVQKQGGQPGPLQLADPADISLWGHSMGGGIALRVLVVNPDVRAAVLYGSMSGDEYKNFQRIFEWTDGRSGQEELAIPPEEMARIAPINHLDAITAAVAIHHGTADTQVPLSWSVELCEKLRELGKTVTCYTYEGQPHYFWGAQDELFRQRVVDFFKQN